MGEKGDPKVGVNCKVSPDVSALETLRQFHPWIPGRENIRPVPEHKKAKEAYLHEICTRYNSEADYALQTVFGIATGNDPNTGKLRAMCRDGASGEVVGEGTVAERVKAMAPAKMFDRNMFPYGLPDGTKHWTMWYVPRAPAGGDDEVTRDIANGLRTRVHSDDFEFVWYENPKMTIPEIYHVQVFWHRI